jgi:hypothetical protein
MNKKDHTSRIPQNVNIANVVDNDNTKIMEIVLEPV